MVTTIEDTLKERGGNYGAYHTHAAITQALMDVMTGDHVLKGENNDEWDERQLRWLQLPPYMKEALHMTAHKIGRILNGKPDMHDHWHDIVGYNKLVADEILKLEKNKVKPPIVPSPESSFHGVYNDPDDKRTPQASPHPQHAFKEAPDNEDQRHAKQVEDKS